MIFIRLTFNFIAGALIIAFFIGLATLLISSAREESRRLNCSNNLRQMGQAVHHFHETNQRLPSSRLGPQHATWLVLILPYINQDDLYRQWNLAKPYYAQTPAVQSAFVRTYICPTRRSTSMQSHAYEVSSVGIPDTAEYPGTQGDYACNGELLNGTKPEGAIHHGIMYPAMSQLDQDGNIVSTQFQVSLKNILDGTSQTLLIGEKHSIKNYWGNSGMIWCEGAIWNGDYPCNYSRVAGVSKWNLGNGPNDTTGQWHHKFGSWHPNVCQFVFADGHVASLANRIDVESLQLLSQPNDGDLVINRSNLRY